MALLLQDSEMTLALQVSGYYIESETGAINLGANNLEFFMSDWEVEIFSMWYLVPVTYFDRSHDLFQLGSGHADIGQLLSGTETTRSPFGSPRRTIPWISL